jgi:hypothetical protein
MSLGQGRHFSVLSDDSRQSIFCSMPLLTPDRSNVRPAEDSFLGFSINFVIKAQPEVESKQQPRESAPMGMDFLGGGRRRGPQASNSIR